jgi:hypothetical protein
MTPLDDEVSYWVQTSILTCGMGGVTYTFPTKGKIYYATFIKDKPKIKSFIHQGDLIVPMPPINTLHVAALGVNTFDYGTGKDRDLAMISSLIQMRKKEEAILNALGKHADHIVKVERLAESWMDAPCVYEPSKSKLLCYIEAAYFGFNSHTGM